MVHDPQFLFIPSLSFFPSLPFFSFLSATSRNKDSPLRFEQLHLISYRLDFSSISHAFSQPPVFPPSGLFLIGFYFVFLWASTFLFSLLLHSFFVVLIFIVLPPPLSLLLPWFGGLALLLCLADCDHLTNIMSPHCSSPTVAAGSSPEILICSLFPTPFRGLRHSSGPQEFSCVCVCLCVFRACVYLKLVFNRLVKQSQDCVCV